MEIAAPAESVWPWLTEEARIKQWMIGVQEDKPTSEGPPGVGSTFRMKIKEGGRVSEYDGEITAWSPPTHLGIRMSGGAFREGDEMFVDYRLEPLAAGRTRLDYSCTMEMRGTFMKLMGGFFSLFARMQLKGFMKNLKRLVENEQTQEGQP